MTEAWLVVEISLRAVYGATGREWALANHEMDAVLSNAIAPVLENHGRIDNEERIIRRFHFFREHRPGPTQDQVQPYLLVRIRGEEDPVLGDIKRAIQDSLAAFVEESIVSGIKFSDEHERLQYIGEPENFGDVGSPIAMQYFEAASRVALHFLTVARHQRGWRIREDDLVHLLLNPIGHTPTSEAALYFRRHLETRHI